MTLDGRLRIGAAIAAAACLSLPAAAATGKVVDADGNPVADARICYVAAGVGETFCVRTAADGRYALPSGSLPSLRISAKGFFVQSVPANDRAEPVVLVRAGAIAVRLVDAGDGEAVEGGEVYVLLPWGEEKGPFPVNAAGVEIGSLPPGPATVVGRCGGYLESRVGPVAIEAGRPRTLVLKLVALAPARPAAQP